MTSPTFGPANTISSYLPLEFQMEGDEEYVRELIAERERLTASILNIKENANYEKRELLSAQQWFSTNVAGQPLKPRYGFRTTADLVALNAAPIPPGVTLIVLTPPPVATIPPAIVGGTIPLPSHGSATDINGVWYFLNDQNINITFTPATNTFTITNNLGVNLTQLYFEIEYLKT